MLKLEEWVYTEEICAHYHTTSSNQTLITVGKQ